MREYLTIVLLPLALTLALGAVVKTRLGPVRGWKSASRDGRVFQGFTGMPYAKPPVGRLRLKDPEPVEPWTSELDATKDGPHCLQRNMIAGHEAEEFLGQEDCLYLNVYAPEGATKLPVLVRMHGGGFRMGYSGSREMADYFMDEDVVLVGLTYRLGPLGFFSLEDTSVPGNFGLKDQAMALKWISENVDSFGGDPGKITVFGESAGGASAHYHMYSPLSKDLVKGVISQSGVVNKLWSLAPRPGFMRERSLKLAAEAGCTSEPTMLDCLQQADPNKLFALESLFNYWGIDDIVAMRPVIEANYTGAFLTADPFSLKPTTPWITGFAAGEHLLKTVLLKMKPRSVMEDFKQRFDEVTALQLNLNPADSRTKHILEKVKDRYYKLQDLDALIEEQGKFFEDGFFVFPAIKSIQKHKGPAYLYYLEYRGEGTYFSRENSSKPAHADELFLLFNMKRRFNLTGTEEDTRMSKAVVKLWANFASHQDPTPQGHEFAWPQYDKRARKFLRIANEGLLVGENGWPELYSFWDKLYKPPKNEEL